MANMTTEQRAACLADMLREFSSERQNHTLTKAQFQAAIDAADGWCNSNAASFNTALPVAARNALTSAQKARLLSFVALRRYATGG